ncbi:MAG: type II toxin-antitoxin system HicA family toxin [bacterium]|nr:type II toxin-antitoxin system HicA family toxin [bacterium]
MTKRDKRLKKLRQNPKDVSFDEIKQILEDFGFIHVRTSGSHHTFIAIIGEKNWRLTMPFHRPIKIPYIKQAIEAIDEILMINSDKLGQEIIEDDDVTDND